MSISKERKLTYKKIVKSFSRKSPAFVNHYYHKHMDYLLDKDGDFIEDDNARIVDYCNADYYSSISNTLQSIDYRVLNNKSN